MLYNATMISYKIFRKEALKDKEVLKEYKKLEAEFKLIEQVIERRIKLGLSQEELALRLNTKQSAISRLESGTYNPSVNFLSRLAVALNSKLLINLKDNSSTK